jgi:hypothetical protein
MSPPESTERSPLAAEVAGAAARDPAARARPGARAGWLAMLGVTALFLAVSWLSFDEIEEDAFIYYRVAANLARGEGFTFNRGAPPIECSSSLTYQLLLVPFALLSLDPILSSKLLGIALGVLALWLLHWIARRLTDDPLFAALPPLILAVSIPFYHWSQRGLETPLYVCLLLAAVGCAFHPRWRERWYWPAFALVCTRPEGLLLALGFVLSLLPKRRELARFSRGLLVLAALCGALLALRLAYFHDLVPNPFYTKLRSSTESGLLALWTFARSGGILWVLVPGALAALAGKRWSRDAVLVGIMAACATAWAVLGEDWKPYNRHLVPALPFRVDPRRRVRGARLRRDLAESAAAPRPRHRPGAARLARAHAVLRPDRRQLAGDRREVPRAQLPARHHGPLRPDGPDAVVRGPRQDLRRLDGTREPRGGREPVPRAQAGALDLYHVSQALLGRLCRTAPRPRPRRRDRFLFAREPT